MHRRWLRQLLPLMLLSIVPSALAVSGAATPDEKEWTALMVSADRDHKPERFLAAVNLARRFGKDDPRLHISLHNAGVVYGFYKPILGESLLREDIAHLERIDIDFPDIACSCYELAKIYNYMGRYSAAESMLMRSLEIRNKWQDLSGDKPYTAQIYALLYIAYRAQGKVDKANKAKADMEHAVELLRTDMLRAECLNSIQDSFQRYASCGKLAQKEVNFFLKMGVECSNKAVSYRRKIGDTYDYASELLHTANLYLRLGQLTEAEGMARKSLDLVSADFESMGTLPGAVSYLLMQILAKMHRYPEIEQLQEQQMWRLAQVSGYESTSYKQTLIDYASFWEQEHRSDLAEKWRHRQK